MRILIDHSGYELNNIGDLAMLVSTVRRVQDLAPNADVDVITVEQADIERILPGTRPVLISGLPNWLPDVLRQRGRVRWKRRAKWLGSHGVRFLPSQGDYSKPRLASLADAINAADWVVAAGGGYVNDVFPAHGRGVLHTLDRAQKLGKRTAMFGQGLGPIQTTGTMALASRVLCSLDTLTLREGVEGPKILEKAGVPSSKWRVTGDDALYLAADAVRLRLENGESSLTSTGFGLNLRLASYAGTSAGTFSPVREAVAEFHEAHPDACLVGVPIMSEDTESDLIPIRSCIPANAPSALAPVRDPDELVRRVSQCRALVTGSYHAAVFALSLGVPVVALANSKYYDWKFGGLQAIYGEEMVSTIVLSDPEIRYGLRDAIDNAWSTPASYRQQALKITTGLLDDQDQAYRSFFRQGF